MNGVRTVDQLRASGMTRPFVDLLPRRHWHEMWDRPEKDFRRLAGLRSLNLTMNEFTKVDVGGLGLGRP